MAVTISPPISPESKNPEKSIYLSMPKTAKIASKIPNNPSPAINPEQNRIPPSASLFFSFSFFFLSINQRITPPIIIGVESSSGRYNPMATGKTGIPNISITIATNTPINTSAHGRLPSITPQ